MLSKLILKTFDKFLPLKLNSQGPNRSVAKTAEDANAIPKNKKIGNVEKKRPMA